jgi:hypothetical protein
MSAIITRPWASIARHYLNSGATNLSILALGEIASRLGNSRYGEALFGWTSMWDLCITQIPVKYPYNGPYLRIAPIAADRLEFRYVDTHIGDRQWHREVPADEAFARLETFLMRDLKWFAPLSAPAAS